MSDPESAGGFDLKTADKALKAATQIWFLTMLIGQWIFVYYIVAYYGGKTLKAGLPGFAETHLPHGYIPGDTLGNLAVASHMLLAVVIHGFGPLQLLLGAIITGGGPRQLTPKIRARARPFHRWNGRIFMLCAVVTSIAGIYMTWFRGDSGIRIPDISITSIAVLIFLFAALALRHAIARDIDTHRRWALRLFMVASAVWFGRLMIYSWISLAGDSGFDASLFQHPVYFALGFGQILIPLGVLQIYLHTQERAGARGKFAMAGGLLVVTVLMGAGIYAATTIAWLPRL